MNTQINRQSELPLKQGSGQEGSCRVSHTRGHHRNKEYGGDSGLDRVHERKVRETTAQGQLRLTEVEARWDRKSLPAGSEAEPGGQLGGF